MTSITRKAPSAARIVLGLVFFVFGLNGFLHVIPQPPPSGAMATYFTGLVASGYFIPFLKGTEVAMGIALLSNRFVPLALTILAPIVLNIFAVHAFMAPAGLPLAVVVLALELYLAWAYRDSYALVVRARVSPKAQQAESAPIGAPQPAR